MYQPTPVPNDAEGLRAWLETQVRLISVELGRPLQLTILGAEPARPADGMIVYADGTAWDPGSGEGVYARENGAWVKL